MDSADNETLMNRNRNHCCIYVFCISVMSATHRSQRVSVRAADRRRSLQIIWKTSFIVYTNCIPYENVTVCALIVAIYMHKVSTCTFVYAT